LPGTMIIGAALQLWKQYSLTLPCNTLQYKGQVRDIFLKAIFISCRAIQYELGTY
jgi:hypothetical protein